MPQEQSDQCPAPFLHSLITRMLQRDPKRRASLEEIESHPWLQGVDPSPATKYNIPLVSYKNLSEEEHNSIIQRMVLGDIADRDAIVEYVCLAVLGSPSSFGPQSLRQMAMLPALPLSVTACLTRSI